MAGVGVEAGKELRGSVRLELEQQLKADSVGRSHCLLLMPVLTEESLMPLEATEVQPRE